MALLSISAHDIDAAGLALDAELPLVWLKEELADADLQGHAPGRVHARLSRSGSDIVVRGKVTADLRTPCARCLEPASVLVDTELSLLLRPAPSGAGPHAHAPSHANGHGEKGKADAHKDEEYEFSSEEADLDTYDGETVVLDPFVREAILLEVPNFPLCSDDCPGIRPAAPASAPEETGPRVDPRLAPLSALREKLQAAKRPSRPPPAAEKKTKIAAKAAGKTKKDKE
ncbi:Hypothetical protein A7982_02969 [Minicystis rosea]|nr:Hypothetical protein A7982_02969 [Minicystis rosea]